MGESRGSSIIILFPCVATSATSPKTHSADLPTVVTWYGTCLKMSLGVGGPFCWLPFLSACPVSLSGCISASPTMGASSITMFTHTHFHLDQHLILLATALRPPRCPTICTISQRLSIPTPHCLGTARSRHTLLAYRSQHPLSFLGSVDVYKLIDICGPLSS